MTTLLGKSAFDERHPLSLGTGSYCRTAMAEDYLNHCDALFAVGTSLSRYIFTPVIPSGKRVIVHATADSRDLNKDYFPDVALLGDAKLTLRQMIEEIRSQTGGRQSRAGPRRKSTFGASATSGSGAGRRS